MILPLKKMTMTSNDNPWADIPSAPLGRFSRRRANLESQIALFWIRDESNRPGLLIEIAKTISSTALRSARVNIRDIFIDVLDIAEEEIRALVIILEDNSNRDVFLKLCLDLIERVTASKKDENTFLTICQRLKKWQSLLSGQGRNLLSQQEIQGLYSELYFIGEMLEKNAFEQSLAIEGWKGPDHAQQDFILNEIAVEIKSIAGSQRGKVQISSEDQLDTHLDQLYLRVYFLSDTLDSGKGESLNAVVRRIATLISDNDIKNLLELKLDSARYIDIPDYDYPLFVVREQRTYLVSENFPRITRGNLPEGIEGVSYDLVLASIEGFKSVIQVLGN